MKKTYKDYSLPKDSETLVEYYSEHFDKWWDPDKFDWDFSGCLARYCSEHFDKWWDHDKFDWDYSSFLARFCPKNVDKWYDKDKVNCNIFQEMLRG
jgi:hypothetical protein